MATTPEQVVDELASKSSPDDVSKVDAQFAARLSRLEEQGDASGELVEHLREMWSMLKAPDDIVPWKSKALIMAALSYFVSPFDLLPDALGKVGLMDDAAVARIVWGRIQPAIDAFRATSS